MKRVLIALCCASFVWTGCTENNPSIDFGSAAHTDTTYVLPAASIPSAQPHQVLVEEFTGQKCANCPAAHTNLENIATTSTNIGRVNVIGLYIYGPGQSVPPAGSIYDLRDSAATQVNTTVYNGKNDLPSGGVDRTPVAGDILLYSTGWADAVTNQLSIADSLNLDISSSYNATTNVATILAKVTYLYPVLTPQNISIAIVEDSMYDKQEFPDSVHENYLFTNVFRDMITSAPLGDPLGSLTAKEAGRVYERVYSYTPKTLSPAIVPAHCRVIAWVNNNGTGGNYRVIQSKQCKL